MSFGYSVGDCLAVGQLAWKVYKSCRDAPESFSNIQYEVLSLHAVLKEVEETLPSQQLAIPRQQRLATISAGCEHVLNDLQALIEKYESLGSRSKRTWDRMRWGSTEVAELRARLTSNTMLLTAFMSTSQITVERQLNKLVQEFQEGKHEGSVLTVATIESISMYEKQTWRVIRKELEDIGISVAAFDANKSFIMNWFHQALENGAFEEQRLGDDENGKPEMADGCQSTNRRDSASIQELQSMKSRSSSFCRSNNSVQDTSETLGTPVPEEDSKEVSKDVESNQKQPSVSRPPPSTDSSDLSRPLVQHNGAGNRKRPLKVAAVISWMLRYDKALHEQCRKKNFGEATILLKKGANINSLHYYDTPLSYAVRTLNINAVDFLWSSGADIEYINGMGRTALHEAIQHSTVYSIASKETRLAVIEYLLQHGARIDVLDKRFRTPLERAITRGDTDVVELLIKYGQSVHSPGGKLGLPLAFAVEKGNIGVVKCLLDHGADVDTVNLRSEPLYLYAIRLKKDDTARLLVERGAKIPSVQALPLMTFAVVFKCPQTLEFLASMFPEQVQKVSLAQRSSPLISAILMRDHVSFQILVKGGARLGETFKQDSASGFKGAPKDYWQAMIDL